MKTRLLFLFFTGLIIPGFIAGQANSDKNIVSGPNNGKVDCLTCPSYDYWITPISSYQTHSSSIVSNGCKIYLLSVSESTTYTFKTGCGDGAMADFDTFLELYDGSCNYITGDDDGCESARSIITWTATYSGYAFLKVRGYNSSHYGVYTLAYQGYDPNLCKTCPSFDYTITPYPYYQTHLSSIQSDGCKIYAVDVTSGRQYTFKTGCGDGASADFDTYLELYDNGCSILAADDDGCESGWSIIVWNATYTGTIYVKVRGYNSYAYGSYTMAYLEVQLPNIWLGLYNYQWENPVNWSLSHVPTADEDVIIAPYGYQPCIIAVASQQCRSLEIQAGAGLAIDNQELQTGGNITINGNLSMYNTSVVRTKGNWQRNPVSGTFSPGTGKVVFNRDEYNAQYCSSENFNDLELDNEWNLIILDGNVTCNKYDWTSGAILTDNGITFTAFDLVDNGIFGSFAAYGGSVINLYNYDGYVDLNGSLIIADNSCINVYGGTSASYWPYYDNALIQIHEGCVLDFKDQGIVINNSPYSLILYDWGGTIRTSRGFIGNRSDFQPDNCTFEFYGTSDEYISQSNGCTLHNVVINKTAKAGEKSNAAGPLIDERSGMVISDGGKSNAISLGSDFTITGSLTIQSGSTFDLSGYDCMVAIDVDNAGNIGITQPSDLSANKVVWKNGSNDNITSGTIHVNTWIFEDGTLANLGTGNTAYVTSSISTGNQENAFGNLVMDHISEGTLPCDTKGAYDLIVTGDLTVAAGSWSTGMNVDVEGDFYINPNASFTLGDDDDMTVHDDAEIAGYIFLPFNNNFAKIYGDLTLPSTGTLMVYGGLLQCNGGGSFPLDGSIVLSSPGSIYFPQSTNIIGSTFNDNGITGGTLQFGGPLIALTPGTFQINSALVRFTGEVENRYINLANGNWLDDVKITGSIFPQKLENDLLIKGNLEFNYVTFNINGKTLTVDGDIDLSSGKLALQPGSHLDLGNAITISQSGTFESLGTVGNQVHVYKGISDNYSFDVLDNGHIKSSYTLFEGMNASGIHILGSGIVDPLYPFSNCTFSNGGVGGSLLTFDNTQSLTIQSPVFPTNTWSGLYNITKTSNSGIIELNSATGGFAGPDFENDPFSRVNWTGGMAGLWTGNVSSDWFTVGNWSSFTLPDALVSVLISPGCPNYPVLNGAQGHCYNLTVDPGANLTIGNNKLLASNFVYISGNLTMTDALGSLQAKEVYFLAGSTDDVNFGEIRTDYFIFNENTLARFSGMNTVYCAWAACEDPLAEFANLHIVPYSKKGIWPNGDKTGYPIRVTGDFVMEPGSYYTPFTDLIVTGNSELQSGAILGDYSGPELDMTCSGNLTIAGIMRLYYSSEVLVHGNLGLTGYLTIYPDCEFTCDFNSASGWTTLNGTLDLYPGSDLKITGANVLIGPSFNLIEQAPYPPYYNAGMTFGRSLSAPSPNFQIDHIYTAFTGSNTGHYIDLNESNYLMSFVINKYSGGDFYLQSNIKVKDLVSIGTESTLRAYDKTILVGGDWYENQFSGGGGFVPMTGRVIFNGTTDQTIYGQADFNILEINKPGGQLVVPSGSSSVCNSYDYTLGGIRVDGGTFTSNDLSDDGFYGINVLNTGTINILQDPSQSIFLAGNMSINGGQMNVTGGSDLFNWGFYQNCHVAMSGGILNINTPEGWGVPDNYTGTFSENITGGTIKVTSKVDIRNSGFTPIGGTIEMTGSNPAIIAFLPGPNLYNLTINKTTTGDAASSISPIDPNDPENGEANDVYLTADVPVFGTLTVAKGILDLNGYSLSVSGDAFVNNGGTLTVDNNAKLLMGTNKTLAVTEGGKLNIIGSSGSEARISHISAGNYTFNIEQGGTLGAQYGIFEYMNTNGIDLKAGSIVDAAIPFNNCIFRNGISSGRLLTISNNQNFTVNNAIFPTNTWGGQYNVYKNATSGVVNFMNATGGFAGATYEYDPNNLVNWTQPYKTLNLKVYLEGLFNGVTLNKAQDEFGDHFPGNTADKATVELHNATNYLIIEFSSGLVDLSTGGIISISTIPNGLSGSYYITTKHRNSIETTSASAISFAGSTISYDFTTSAAKAYGENQKHVGGGNFAIWGGDVNQDGAVDTNDMGDIDNDASNFILGYVVTDVNGDGIVDTNDMGIVDNNSNMFVVAVTP